MRAAAWCVVLHRVSFHTLQGGNSVGWCVDVGMGGTGASELSRAAAWCVVLHPASLPCRVVIICKNEKAVFVISYISNVYKFVWVPILRKSQICMLKKKSALSYKFVCVVTHRCGRLHPDCPVMMSGWLQSFHTLQANSTSMPVAALGGNSVGWCAGGRYGCDWSQ